jgi:hypothetical protein
MRTNSKSVLLILAAIIPPCLGGCSDSASGPVSAPPPAADPARAVPALEPAKPVANGEKVVEQPEAVKPRRILGQKTSDIRDAEQEQAKGAQQSDPRITGQDPITISGNAYVSIIGRIEVLRIKHTVDAFHAINGRYPKDLDEFMTEIIKKNGIKLAQLPYYQEYGYSAEKHELIILEYPDRKAAAGQ